MVSAALQHHLRLERVRQEGPESQPVLQLDALNLFPGRGPKPQDTPSSHEQWHEGAACEPDGQFAPVGDDIHRLVR